MIRSVLLLIPIAFAISLPLTAVMMLLGRRLRAFDSPGVAGQVKPAPRQVPNTGGVAIFWAIVLPMLGGLLAIWLLDPAWVREWSPAVAVHLDGMRERTGMAVTLIGCMGLLHLLGLIDDRRPMGPWVKLLIMAAPAVAMPALYEEARLLELLDREVPGGVVITVALTALWFLIVTNAMNFMDNMDGLSAGVAAIAGGCFLGASLVVGQWFVAAVLALLIGACLGFLMFNFPPPLKRGGGQARIFMGDGGSLVLGFLLAFLTVRVTYYDGTAEGGGPLGGGWYAVFMPIVVLAVPIYDFVSVVSIRLAQGKSPFVGDMQHLSHRLVKLGLSRRTAVLVIYGLTTATGISGIVLGSLRPWQAVLVGVQIMVLLGVIAMFEYARARSAGVREDAQAPRAGAAPTREPGEAQHV